MLTVDGRGGADNPCPTSRHENKRKTNPLSLWKTHLYPLQTVDVQPAEYFSEVRDSWRPDTASWIRCSRSKRRCFLQVAEEAFCASEERIQGNLFQIRRVPPTGAYSMPGITARTHTRTHAHTHTHAHTNLFQILSPVKKLSVFSDTCPDPHAHTHTHTHMRAHINTRHAHTQTHMHTQTHTTHAHTHTQTHTHTNTHTHTHTQTHTHM